MSGRISVELLGTAYFLDNPIAPLPWLCQDNGIAKGEARMEECDICSGSRLVRTTGRDGVTNCKTILESPCTACKPEVLEDDYEEHA